MRKMNDADFSMRIYAPAEAQAITALNNSEVPHVSRITHSELLHLAQQAKYLKIAETPTRKIVGFLLALDETAVYDSLNFLWFKKRYPKFIYIDRIVIAPSHQRRGLGKSFYEDLNTFASLQSRSLITCEVNLRPENPESLSFHKTLGFRQVGTQDTEGGKKTVSLMVREASHIDAP
jgi:predicted GNAT superfamily acetyltransferase